MAVLDLYSNFGCKNGKGLSSEFVIARTMTLETLNFVFLIYRRFPNLDVAGSSPVSRSIFSIVRPGDMGNRMYLRHR